ncbi:hypothetical protein DAEQUDRAFT_729731 [Daedalea quercina L-15889]|uniref:Uncharacterized protein n=1 Tax=Daedalea quercina L-15889 TaxID=1314783 RepID=A0A165NGD9_9APHY|nr:hypothetical protein DAEQUDRAFT_729731 [Daedalea quercina L-15889]
MQYELWTCMTAGKILAGLHHMPSEQDRQIRGPFIVISEYNVRLQPPRGERQTKNNTASLKSNRQEGWGSSASAS